jgi:hypothetical protein
MTVDLRVETGLRLIQDQDLRLVNQSQANVQSALHAARERLRQLVPAVKQTKDLQKLQGPLSRFAPAEVIEPSHKLQLLAAGQ